MTPRSWARPSTIRLASGHPAQPWAVNSSTTTGSARAAATRGRAPAGWAVDPTAAAPASITAAPINTPLSFMSGTVAGLVKTRASYLREASVPSEG